MAIIPPFLRKGDKVAIVSPASAVNPDYVDGACRVLEEWGYVPVVGKHCKGKNGYYSGTLEERLADFKEALQDTSIKAVLCSRGGYGAVHLVEHLPIEEIRNNAKWLIGFSDISVLHALFNHAEIATIHASMAKHLSLFGTADERNKLLHRILEGELPVYNISAHEYNKAGEAVGELLGGNLAVLSGLIGTDIDILKKDKILFIEDIGEPIYKVERMLYTLRLSGVLSHLRGMIVGQFTGTSETNANGETMYSMIREMVRPYSFPVAFDFPCGHIDENVPLIEGITTRLTVTPHSTRLEPA